MGRYEPSGWPGRQGTRGDPRHISNWAEAWEDWSVELEQLTAAGDDQVVLLFRERGRSDSGLAMDERHAELYTLKDGKIVRRQGFSDPNKALEAAGLSE
jgi:ketosteroid isomerase-like protein